MRDNGPQPSSRGKLFVVGFATMSLNKLWESVQLAHRVRTLSNQDNEDDVAEAGAAMRVLEGRLALVAIVPTVVGSGMASLPSKLHCLTHACKLTTRTWKDCGALLNAAASCTGDLGTEAGVTKAPADLRDFFGPWIEAQGQALGVLDGKEPSLEAEFTCRPEANGEFVAPAEGARQSHETREAAMEGPYTLQWKDALFLPGVMHTLHDFTEDMRNS